MSSAVAVVLAAGKSTRMKSRLPKVLHPVCGRLMIDFVLDAAREAGVKKIVVIVGHKSDEVKAALSGHNDVVFAEQTEQNGTGHAVMMAEPELRGHDGSALILAGDTPLLQGSSLSSLLGACEQDRAACVIGTADTQDNEGLGRVVRDANGNFERIVEQKDANDEQQRITEINTGCYAFSTPLLLDSLNKLKPDNAQAEYYLTDCPRILMDDGHRVSASCSLTIQEAIGVNNRVQLAEVRAIIQADILKRAMLSGVTVVDPAQTSIDVGVTVGQDTVILPGCVIERGVKIGQNCSIGPNVYLREGRQVSDGSVVGPP